MRTERVAALLVAVLVVFVGLGVAVPDRGEADEPTESPTPTASPSASPPAGVIVDDAVLRWGINNESSNRAYAPRTYNFFSAGLVPDPGRGGTTLPRARWQQRAGDVAVQKWNGVAWRPATWGGLSTDSDGKPLGSPTSGTLSNHRFVMSGGTGTIDRAAGTARIEWDGDVTVLYYSGMSFFHISDPVLEVADGRGTLTATVRGYASSVDDPNAWAPVPATAVTLAELPDVDLADERGFTATPAYLGVTVSGAGQAIGGPDSGAFPQSFVDYMSRLGTAAFWVSSGAATDGFKVPLPITVGYDASVAVPEPTPTSEPTLPPIDNPVIDPPPASPPATPAPVPTPVAAPDPPAALPPSAAPVPVAVPAPVPGGAVPVAAGALPVADQLVAVSAAPVAATPPPGSGDERCWWIGAALLALALATLLVPAGRPGRRTTPCCPSTRGTPRKEHRT